MFSFITPSRAVLCLALTTVFAGALAVPRQANATEVVPLTLTETIRQAETIVVGRVVSQNTRWGTEAKRWMFTDYTIAVEEVVAAEAGTQPIGEKIVVSYWGGTLEGETQFVSDCRRPQIDERLVFILAPGWRTEPGVSPVVGFNYGLLSVAAGEDSAEAVVLDANGTPLVRREDGLLGWRGATPAAEANSARVELPQFVTWVRENIGAIKAAPSELPPQGDASVGPNDPRGIKMFAKTPYDPAAAYRPPFLSGPGVLPTGTYPASEAAVASTDVGVGPLPDYNFGAKANRFVTVNNFQSTFPWSPVDQQMLSNWNYYTDIYRVFASPTGTFAWTNNVFDLSGFPSSTQLQSTYGTTWPSNVIAYCFSRGDPVIVESDIAMNPAFSFTLDDEAVYNGGSARSFRQVMLHEMCHMWGLNHNFNFPSIMNDSQDVFRFFGFPYMDDAEATRAAYSAGIVARTDLAIYLRYSVGTQSMGDVTFPASVAAGSSFSVNNYHVENMGTTTISTPTIEWYLTSARNFATSHFLGSTTYGSLARFQYHAPATTSVARTLTIPSNVPAGSYYLAAFIRNDSSPQQSTFPFNNDSSWSRTKMTVTAAPGALQVTINPAGAVSAGAQWQVDGGAFQNSGATVSNLSVGNHTVSFKAVSGWTTPSNQTVAITANNTTTTSGTYTAPAGGSVQVTIAPAGAISAGAQWQVNGGAFQNSGATVGNLTVGNHTVSFKPVSGWTTPSSQTVSVTANNTTTTTGTYVAIPQTGSVQVTIAPAGAISAGAQWQVDGGAFQNSGAIVSGLSAGDHTISFKPVSGWTTPSNQLMPVSAGTTNSTSGTYVTAPTTGSLQVTINPAGAVSAGAQWQVDGGTFQDSGAILSGLSPGDHTISFKPVSGWSTPTNQIMPVTAGTTNATSGTYTAPALQLASASSVKAHGSSGTFGINLPLSGTSGVECRTGGAAGNHTLVFTFSSNVVSGNTAVTSGVGSVSGTPSFAGNTMTVELTGVTNAQRLTVSLNNVTDTASQVMPTTSIPVGFLTGDTNGSGGVNATDIGQTKAQSGQTVTATNFKMDVTANGGAISSSDVGLVKSAAGAQLP